jgi:hypothetical protein
MWDGDGLHQILARIDNTGFGPKEHLFYTASRVDAAAKLRRGNLYHAGDQWMFPW